MKKEGFLPLIGFHFPLLQGFVQFVKPVDDIFHLNFFRIFLSLFSKQMYIDLHLTHNKNLFSLF